MKRQQIQGDADRLQTTAKRGRNRRREGARSRGGVQRVQQAVSHRTQHQGGSGLLLLSFDWRRSHRHTPRACPCCRSGTLDRLNCSGNRCCSTLTCLLVRRARGAGKRPSKPKGPGTGRGFPPVRLVSREAGAEWSRHKPPFIIVRCCVEGGVGCPTLATMATLKLSRPPK
jgi:hypothetical protein